MGYLYSQFRLCLSLWKWMFSSRRFWILVQQSPCPYPLACTCMCTFKAYVSLFIFNSWMMLHLIAWSHPDDGLTTLQPGFCVQWMPSRHLTLFQLASICVTGGKPHGCIPASADGGGEHECQANDFLSWSEYLAMVIFAVELELQYWQKASICYLSDGWGHDKEYC